MSEIRKIIGIEPAVLRRLITGYTTEESYQTVRTQSGNTVSFILELTKLKTPYNKEYDRLDDVCVAHYQKIVSLGHSFGAFEQDQCIGIAIGEPVRWNLSFWIREIHVQSNWRGCHIGSGLMTAMKTEAAACGSRVLVCETQNTNVPAISFYQAMGFRLEGIDISYYSNEDLAKGEVAVFMKMLLKEG